MAARRYACAVRERDVVGYLNDDGTATVTGSNLPTDQAAMACARIEDLAKAAKRAGHPGRVGHLRAGPPCSAATVTLARFPAGERSVLTLPALWPPRRAAPRGASPSRMRPHLVFAGMTRRRPHAGGIQSLPRRGGVVELHVSESLLTVLAADPPAAVSGPESSPTSSTRTCTDTGPQDPTARFAGAALRRHIQLRDRSCVFMGCRCPARGADLDHTLDHARHGATNDANQGPACRHDHRLKHVGGWRLSQPEPGYFFWVSPSGGSATRSRRRSSKTSLTHNPACHTPPTYRWPRRGITDPATSTTSAGPFTCAFTRSDRSRRTAAVLGARPIGPFAQAGPAVTRGRPGCRPSARSRPGRRGRTPRFPGVNSRSLLTPMVLAAGPASSSQCKTTHGRGIADGSHNVDARASPRGESTHTRRSS